MLIMMAGLPGTGKSVLSRALAARCGGVVLDKDSIRAALFSPPHIEYSRQQDDFCQEIMLATAGFLLARTPALQVFLDGRPFSQRYQRRQVEIAAGRLHTPLAIIECRCSQAIALARLRADAGAGLHPAGNRGPDLYFEVQAAFETLAEPRLTLDTGLSLEDCVRRAEAYLANISRPCSNG